MKKLSVTEMMKVNGGGWLPLSVTKIIYGILGTAFASGFLDGIFRPFRCR